MKKNVSIGIHNYTIKISNTKLLSNPRPAFSICCVVKARKDK